MSDISFLVGDCRQVLKTLPRDSFDSLVTDPPSGIGILNNDWDEPGGMEARISFIHLLTEVFVETRRVLKPGAYGLVWSLPRTSHWTATSLEAAGFELRDCLNHIFSSGYPKHRSCLKPAHEMWWLVRNPGPSVEDLHLDVCQVNGRWPPNLLLSHDEGCEQVGTRELKGQKTRERPPDPKSQAGWGFKRESGLMKYPTDQDGYETLEDFRCVEGCPVQQLGDNSRFFYCAKPKGDERDAGVRSLYWRRTERGYEQVEFVEWTKLADADKAQGNIHPTQKPVELMRWLTRLITRPGGRVLDCFSGSGTTGVACAYEEFSFTGVEQNPAYVTISRARLEAAQLRLEAARKTSREAPSTPSSPGGQVISQADIARLVRKSARRSK